MQKGLSKDRPCFKAVKIACEHKLTQIVCYRGVVLGLTDQCQLVYRDGISKDCLEGKSWKLIKWYYTISVLYTLFVLWIDQKLLMCILIKFGT